MKGGFKVKDKDRVELFYPWIRGQLCEIDDPDFAWDFMNICIANGVISERKAQRMFDKRFPKESLDDWRKFLAKTAIEGESPFEKEKQEAIARRQEVMQKLGFDGAKFEKELERMVKERGGA